MPERKFKKKQMPKIAISATIDTDLDKKIRKLSEDDHQRSLSAMINILLELGYKEFKRKKK